jgi:hypothetical protein
LVTVRPQFTPGAISTAGDTLCYNGDAAVISSTAAANGGDGNITYFWRSSSDNFVSNVSGAVAADLTPPTNSTVTLTYRRYAKDGACNTVGTQSVGEWVLTIKPTPIVTATIIDYPTFGLSDGTATAGYTGGEEPVTIVWSDNTEGPALLDVPFGSYSVTATGNNGCSTTDNIALNPVMRGIVSWSDDPLQGVKNVVLQQTGDLVASQSTDSDGYYVFNPTVSGSNFLLKPLKNTNKLNGVNAADGTKIRRHVTLLDTLPGPYKIIAADVNGDNNISTSDAVLIYQCLLGKPAACNLWVSSWRFVDAEHTFATPKTPWGFPESITLGPTTVRSGNGLDFTGIKIGDVINPGTNPDLRPQPVTLHGTDILLQAGASISLPIQVHGYTDIAAYQFEFDFDPSVLTLAGVDVPAGGLLLNDNFGLLGAGDGKIRSVRADVAGSTVAEGVNFFTLRFQVHQSNVWLGDVLSLTEETIKAEAYTNDLSPQPIILALDRVSGTAETESANYDLTAVPNPAGNSTTVQYNLPVGGEACIRVRDMNGRLIQEQCGEYLPGAHAQTVLFQTPGIYVVELMTRSGKQFIKVISTNR